MTYDFRHEVTNHCPAPSWHISYEDFSVWTNKHDWLRIWDSLPVFTDGAQLHVYLTPEGQEVKVLVSEHGTVKGINK